MEEVSELLNILLKNNDKHIVKIIMEYAYPKCCICKELFDKVYERMRFDEEEICVNCFIVIDWKLCKRCQNYYNIDNNIYCNFCNGQCRVYCQRCFK